MEILKKILNFIKNNIIWTIIIICLMLCFIDGYKTEEYNTYGYILMALVLIAAFAPIIRKQRMKKEKKQEIDYLAKKIVEEQQKADQEKVQ